MHFLSDRTMAFEDCKSCKDCNRSVSSSDPHPTCLSHNTTCVVDYEYDHTVCEFCTPMINGSLAGDKAQKTLLNDRITAMRKAISKAIKANKVPEEVCEPFLRTNDVFKPSVAHLNPGSARNRSQTPVFSDSIPVTDFSGFQTPAPSTSQLASPGCLGSRTRRPPPSSSSSDDEPDISPARG